jgi:hypothetical protein
MLALTSVLLFVTPVWVLPPTAYDVEPAAATWLGEQLVSALTAEGRPLFVESSERAADLPEPPLVLTSSIGRVGQSHVVSLTLTDTGNHRGAVQDAVTVRDTERLVGLLPAMLKGLLGQGTVQAPSAMGLRAKTFAVPTLVASGVPAEVAQSLSRLLAHQLGEELPGARVVTEDDINAMLSYEAAKDRLSCDGEVTCLTTIGGALGVEQMISGHVGIMGPYTVLHLQLLDIGSADVRARVTELFRGDPEQLVPAMRYACRRLLGTTRTQSGAISVLTNIDGARLRVDGNPIGALPLAPVADLPPGPHAVEVTHSGYVPFRTDIYVESGGSVPVFAEMHSDAGPWYARWWVWSVGAAVLGGSALAVAWQEGPTSASATLPVLP